jgi:hypothetical protein
MELGVTLPGQSKSTDRHVVKKIDKAMKTNKIPQHIGTPKPTGIPKPTDTPSRVVLPQGTSQASSRTLIKPIHPRYSIFAYGCSNS